MRQIPLEDRIDALHVVLGNLIAHLDDSGLVDRQILEHDVLVQLDVLESSNRALEDVRAMFGTADEIRRLWERKRSAPDAG